MGKRNAINIYKFYYQYYVLLLKKPEMLAYFKISDPTFQRYHKLCKTLTWDVSTEFMTKELLLLYHTTIDKKDKLSILRELANIWKIKHKVPNQLKSKKNVDLSKLKVPIPNATPA